MIPFSISDFIRARMVMAKLEPESRGIPMDIVWQAEDSLKEKKTESDLKDVLKTLVAFANSVAPGDTATLFIGEKDDGNVQGVTNADNIQKKVKETADKIYPEIYYKTTVYDRDGKHCVRVDVKHNGLAPHFGDAAWVRRGSVTIRATEALYQQMVELRISKVTALTKWRGENSDNHLGFSTRNPTWAYDLYRD
jgi:predicted HTH transcriptional regulator